jgi:hypothetical protein
MYSKIGQSRQSRHPPFELILNVHLVNYHPDSICLPLSVCMTNDLVLHSVFLASQ